VVDLLLCRARQGLYSSLATVESHIGITGNEVADQLANDATEQWDLDLANEHTEPYGDMPWLRIVNLFKSGNHVGHTRLSQTTAMFNFCGRNLELERT